MNYGLSAEISVTHVHIACGHRRYGKAILSWIAFFYYIGNLIATL
nr:MAG TPA: hypothetical protein [Caudoviricetes sp.]